MHAILIKYYLFLQVLEILVKDNLQCASCRKQSTTQVFKTFLQFLNLKYASKVFLPNFITACIHKHILK